MNQNGRRVTQTCLHRNNTDRLKCDWYITDNPLCILRNFIKITQNSRITINNVKIILSNVVFSNTSFFNKVNKKFVNQQEIVKIVILAIGENLVIS